MSEDKQERSQPQFLFAYPVYVSVNYHFGLHAHDHNELVIVQHGRFRSRVGNEEHLAFRGDILLYTARTPHEEWAEDGKPVLSWACAFKYDGFTGNEPVFCWDAHGRVQELMAYLTELHYNDELRREHHRHTDEAPAVLLEVIKELHLLTAYESHGMVDQVRSFIRSRMDQDIAVEDLADVAGVSSSHFIRQYRALTGRTPMDDVRHMRVEEARRLITTTDLTLSQIAPRVGMANEYHLSRLLRQHLGQGVRELRHAQAAILDQK